MTDVARSTGVHPRLSTPGALLRRALPPLTLCVWTLSSLALGVPRFALGDEVRFEKARLDGKFRAEGVAIADVNGDAKKDILAGPLWYEAPDWKAHEIAPVKDYDGEHGYSDTFSCFAEDLNGDGRQDLIVVGFPGLPVRIYENPGPAGLASHWKEYSAFPSCTNESPLYVDLDGDGRREIVGGFEPEERLAWFSPGSQISAPWTCHPITKDKVPYAQRYYHGLGTGDVNGDGRQDVLVPHAWLEAPEDRKSLAWTTHEITPSPPSAHLHLFDFDGDGDQDMVGSSAHAYGIWWYESSRSADGALTWTQHEIDKSYSQTHALILADLNGDGLPDLVTGKRFWAHGPKGDPGSDGPALLCWYELARKEGKPVWTRHEIDNDSGVGTQFEVADINGDSRPDIAISNKKGVFVFLQTR